MCVRKPDFHRPSLARRANVPADALPFGSRLNGCGSRAHSESQPQPADEAGVDVEAGSPMQKFRLAVEDPSNLDEAGDTASFRSQAEHRPVVADLHFFIQAGGLGDKNLVRLDVVLDAEVRPCRASPPVPEEIA